MLTASQLLDSLKTFHLLNSQQLEKLEKALQGRSLPAERILHELFQRKWLTAFQRERITNGHIDELVLDGIYLLQDKLGEGGMGQVFKAKHLRMKAIRAIKIIRPECLTNKNAVARFYREIESISRLNHPNIVQAFDAREVNGTHYLVMEYVEGQTLAHISQERGPLPIHQAADYIRQVAMGLQHTHEEGLVHRDIKPSNLLLTTVGDIVKAERVKILDLGLARLRESSEDDVDLHTRTGALMGTPDFMAPEQATNVKAADIRADIYSLGCTLYQLLVGQVPFPGGISLNKMYRHQSETPAPVSKFRSDVPEGMIQVLNRMLAKNPAERQRVPQDIVDALRPFCLPGSSGVHVEEPTEEFSNAPVDSSDQITQTDSDDTHLELVSLSPNDPKNPSRRPWLIGSVLLCLLAIAGAWWFLSGSNESIQSQLEREYAKYRESIMTGRGSVVVMHELAPTRFADWRTQAESGNAIAQLFLARCYQEGLVVERDEVAAIPWLEKSAAQGNDFAIHTLAWSYEMGLGVKIDVPKAFQKYTEAAELGNPTAMRAVGHLHAGDALGKPNQELALTWYRKSAEAGDAVAMRLVGNAYFYGKGVKVDKTESERWYELAAKAGDSYIVGKRLGDRLAPHFAAYQKADATTKTKSSAIEALKPLKEEFEQLDYPCISSLFSVSDLSTASGDVEKLPADDPLRTLYDELIKHYVKVYSEATHSQRVYDVSSFSRATESLISRWYTDRKFDEIVHFWEQAYKDITNGDLKNHAEYNALIQQLRRVATSLMRTGKRQDAIQVEETALAICDRFLKAHPWDWYLKDAYMGFCFETASTWIELGENSRSQTLLKRAWKVCMSRYGKESLLNRYSTLPLKGKVPSNVTAGDRAFFERFAPNADIKNSGITRLKIPCDFAGKNFPFNVYVIEGPRGYAELLEQFRWVKEMRGGEVPMKVRDSFQRLNRIAVENNTDFRELCKYALDSNAKEKKKK